MGIRAISFASPIVSLRLGALALMRFGCVQRLGFDPRALVQAGLHGFRRFALERPHLFRITFGQLTSEVISDPGAYSQLLRSFEALRSKVERAVNMGAVETRPTVEIVFAFHSFCHGLAVNELSRLPPPVGASFWRILNDADGQDLWRLGLGAFVKGLSPASIAQDRHAFSQVEPLDK